MNALTPENLSERVGHHLGYSDWYPITQQKVDLFADVTNDHQWIHTDQKRAADGPFGGTVAHGFLTLSLLTPLTSEVFDVTGVGHSINYRVDKVRFRAPAPVGCEVRAGVEIVSVRNRPRGFLEVALGVTLEQRDGTVVYTAQQTTLFAPEE